jgi:hypothetical protein
VRICEEGPDLPGNCAQLAERALRDLEKVVPALRHYPGDVIVLHVLPDPFVRVKVRGVRREKEELDAVLPLVDPFPGLLRRRANRRSLIVTDIAFK